MKKFVVCTNPLCSNLLHEAISSYPNAAIEATDISEVTKEDVIKMINSIAVSAPRREALIKQTEAFFAERERNKTQEGETEKPMDIPMDVPYVTKPPSIKEALVDLIDSASYCLVEAGNLIRAKRKQLKVVKSNGIQQPN